MEENFCFNIIKNLQTTIEKTILIVGQEAVTNKQFHKRVSEIAHLLKEENGLEVGQKVLIASAPNVEFYCIAVAVWAIGGIVIILDPSMTFDRINHCVNITKPSFFVYPTGSKLRFLKYIFPAVRAILKSVELKHPSHIVPLMKPSDVLPAKYALVTFTTGTTGMPKQLIREHSYVMEQSASLTMTYNKIAVEFEFDVKECDNPIITNLPVFPFHSLKVGTLVAMIPKFIKSDPAVVLNTIKQYGLSVVIGSPAFVARLSVYASEHNIVLPPAGAGGAPVFRSTVRLIANTVQDKKFAIIYGSTEAEPISLICATEKMALEESKPDGLCVGRPAIKDTVKVIPVSDDPIDGVIDVDQLELPPGEIGEIILSGSHVNTKQADKKRLIHAKDGKVWLRIEDGGYMDKEGRIWLAGRVKWRTLNHNTGVTHWPTVVEQKILERTSLLTFAVYIPKDGKVYLFLEAPNGLPTQEFEGIKLFVRSEGIPVDEFVVKIHIKKDRRHASKPDTGALFVDSTVNHVINNLWFVISHNPLLLMIIVCFILLVLIMITYVIYNFS